MAGTTALHELHSELSKSKSTAAKPKNPATKGAFEKKFATATAVKTLKVAAAKLVTENKSIAVAKQPSAEDNAGPTADQKTADTLNAEVTAKSPAPAKTKAPSDSAGKPTEDPAPSTKSDTQRPVAPIDPDAGHSQSHRETEGRQKSPSPQVHARKSQPPVPASAQAVITPTVVRPVSDAVPNAANVVNTTDTAQTSQTQQDTTATAAAVSTAPQDVQEQLASQPTFGGGTGTTQPDGSEHAADNQSDSAGSAVANANANPPPSVGSASTTAEAFAAAFDGALAGIGHVDATDSHGASASAPSTNLTGVGIQTATAANPQGVRTATSTAATPQARFIEENHPKIVSGISGQLMPKGGTMQLRLDPPGLGALQVTVHLRDGAMSAEFHTSNDEATRMLSHSLGQLKSSLENNGMSVEKLHVEQAPKKEGHSQGDSDPHAAPHEQQQQARQDKQRRELMQRMWAKLSGADPLDMVA